jgi:hypothetical protein
VCPTHYKPSYDTYRDGVTDLVEAGEPFSEVEEAIELADLEVDQKSALWLLAFSKRDRSEQERGARVPLVGIAED